MKYRSVGLSASRNNSRAKTSKPCCGLAEPCDAASPLAMGWVPSRRRVHKARPLECRKLDAEVTSLEDVLNRTSCTVHFSFRVSFP